MVGWKITRQTDGRAESQIGGLKNNSPNGWTDGELNDRLENNSPNRSTNGELNDQLENNSPNRLADAELNGRLENNSPNRWTGGDQMVGSKITRQMES